MNMDLFTQKVIESNVKEPYNKTNLGYHGVIIKGNFDCSNTKIPSLEGAPKEVGGVFSCWGTHITSLEGAPSYVGSHFDCSYTKITSLHNIHQQIKYIGGWFDISSTIKSHILGVMFIKGLRGIMLSVHGGVGGSSGASGSTVGFSLISKELHQAITIINKHLKGNRNPHDVQEELIGAGLSVYAKL